MSVAPGGDRLRTTAPDETRTFAVVEGDHKSLCPRLSSLARVSTAAGLVRVPSVHNSGRGR